jgi:hypothetical protein
MFVNNDQNFICLVCMICKKSKPISQIVCFDPQLCTTCVDEDNKREYELDFG